jgi:hypothetical protein
MPNKAKFRNAKNEHKSLFHNDYEQQTMNNELLKTKPNKANFIGHQPGRNKSRSCSKFVLDAQLQIGFIYARD